MSYELQIMNFEVIILNRVQIYDCGIGVVKCFDVYFQKANATKARRHKELFN